MTSLNVVPGTCEEPHAHVDSMDRQFPVVDPNEISKDVGDDHFREEYELFLRGLDGENAR